MIEEYNQIIDDTAVSKIIPRTSLEIDMELCLEYLDTILSQDLTELTTNEVTLAEAIRRKANRLSNSILVRSK